MIDTWPDWASDSVTDCPYYCPFMFAYYFSLISVYSLIHMLTCYMHEYLSLYFAHSLGRFLTTLNLPVHMLDVLFFWSGVRWDRMLYEDSEFLPFWIWYSCLSFYPCGFYSFLDSIYIRLIASSLFHFHIHCYHACTFICVIAVIMIYYSLKIACSGYY